MRAALVIAVLLMTPLAACTMRVTDPLPLGPDTYTVSSHVTVGGSARAREAALTAAGNRCAAISKQLLVTNIGEHGFGSDANVDVTFRCLAAGDPELRRPNLQQAPNVVIQDQRTR